MSEARIDGWSAQVEQWKPIAEVEDRYSVSDLGRLKRIYRTNGSGPLGLVKPHTNRDGYQQLHTRVRYRTICRSVHRLVMEAFVGPRPTGMQIAHLNGNPADNRLSNLAYVTPAENNAHKADHGTLKRGSPATGWKLRPQQVQAIRTSKESISTLAARYGINRRYVSTLRKRGVWADLPDVPTVDCDLCGDSHHADPDIEAITGRWLCVPCIEATLEGADHERDV